MTVNHSNIVKYLNNSRENVETFFLFFENSKFWPQKIFWYHLLDLIQMWSIDVNFFKILTYQSNLYQVEITQFMRKNGKLPKNKNFEFFVVEFFLVSTKNQQITQKIKEKNKT